MAERTGGGRSACVGVLTFPQDVFFFFFFFFFFEKSQLANAKERLAQSLFSKLLQDASQDNDRSELNSAPGGSCQRLCGFVEQCLKSKYEPVRQWAFTEEVIRKLFEFYLEWYEHDPHRSMRLVLDLLVICLARNPVLRMWPTSERIYKGPWYRQLTTVNEILDQVLSTDFQPSPGQASRYAGGCFTGISNTGTPPSLGPRSWNLWEFFMSQMLSWMKLSRYVHWLGNLRTSFFAILLAQIRYWRISR